MRKYMLVVLIFILSACASGQKRATQPASAPTNAPTETSASNTQPSAGKRDAKSAATNAPVPLTVPTNAPAPNQPLARRPVGVYAHIDLSDLIKDNGKGNSSGTTVDKGKSSTTPTDKGIPSTPPSDLDAQFDSLFQGLLANPAISGLAIGAHWDLINPNPPTAANAYNWSYLDDAFNQVTMWNSKNPTQTPKTIQLIVDAGFDSPQWLLDQIPSCDGLFQSPPQNPASNCGKATFMGYLEPADGTVLPMPWNPTYKSAWQTFLMALAARYEFKPGVCLNRHRGTHSCLDRDDSAR